MLGPLKINDVEKRSEGGRLALTDRTDNEEEALLAAGKVGQALGQIELGEGADFVGNQPESGADLTALEEGVAAEADAVSCGQSEVQFLFLKKNLTVFLVQNLGDDAFGVVGRKDRLFDERNQVAGPPKRRGGGGGGGGGGG